MSRIDRDELSAREAEVLAAIERRLNNAEIAETLYLSVRTVESHVASLRRKLGADSRAKLISAARARRGTALQLPQSSFVGRAAEIEAVRGLLSRHRWVSIVGAAGAGKTRLALELAVSDARVPIVVELERATGGDVGGIVARAIGLGTHAAGDILGACGVALAAQSYLLVLDNCDRVTDEVGSIAAELLALAPTLAVLATSRSPAGGADEVVFPLQPLPTGNGSEGAVRLFVDRARTAAPATRPTDSDLELIARICARLDGLPLAIELAAARVRHLTLVELADRLDAGFGLLCRTGRSDRHSTLEAAFDWTWDLLDDDERLVLSQLAALPLSFDLQLADAVTTVAAPELVLRLLDRSLLSQTATAGQTRRFQLLQPVRGFVLERTDPAVVNRVRHAHAVHYRDQVVRLAGRVRTEDTGEVVDAGKRMAPEVVAAIDWAAARSPELTVALARSLAVVVEHVGPDLASLETIARAFRVPAVRSAAPPSALFEVGAALCYLDLELVSELADHAIAIADDDRKRLAAHSLAGLLEAYRQDGASAFAHLDAAERFADALRDHWQLGNARQARAIALLGMGEAGAAITVLESSMQEFAQAGDAMHVNNVRFMMALAAADSGLRTDEAIVWAGESIDYATASGNDHELAHAVLARAALTGGPEVGAVLRDAIEAFRVVGDLRCLVRSCLLLATSLQSHERVPVLEQALAVASRSGDEIKQATVLERLVEAHWEAGAQRDAARSLGSLIALVGEASAFARSPAGMSERLGDWNTVIAEGRARGTSRTAAHDR